MIPFGPSSWRAALARTWGVRLRRRDFRTLGADPDHVHAIENAMSTAKGREALAKQLDDELRSAAVAGRIARNKPTAE